MECIKLIADNDLCIACGACIFACPKNIDVVFNETKGMYEPKVKNPSKCNELCGHECKALKVCPSYKVDYFELSKYKFGDEFITEIGVVDRIFLAQSTNYDVNMRSSSGGLIKEMLKFLLNRDPNLSVIALQRNKGINYTPQLITSEDIEKLPGSVYHNVDFSNAIKLLEQVDKAVLVAIPCQLEGIYKYIQNNKPELYHKIYRVIGLVCGWTYNHHSLRAISAYKGLKFENLEDVSYRGGGPVGKLRLVEKDGKVTKVNRRVDLKYMASFDRSYNLPRCHFCVNHVNYLADFVVADAWLPSTVFTKTGISLLIARTPEVSQDLYYLQEKNAIRLVNARIEDVIESQTSRVAYGDFSYAYGDFMRKRKEFAPALFGPNKIKSTSVNAKRIEKFHVNYHWKRKLQQQGRYRALLMIKYTRELFPFLQRYFRWFAIRVLKVKSLTGERKELQVDEIKKFR